jgi:hypothetical protein
LDSKYIPINLKEVVMATKIFVRERRKIEKGEKKPRFRIVGVSGSDDKIHADTGAEVVYLQSGKGSKSGAGQA